MLQRSGSVPDLITSVRGLIDNTLIPSVDNPDTPNDYRPISLCNVSYKMVSKLLVNRIKPLLQKIISPEQSAFIQGRNIMDNVLLMQEILHSMGKHGMGANHFAIKLDMEKAYDRMRWDFIETVLLRFGFCRRFVGWIMGCIAGPTFSILVNGSSTDWFSSTRGLRQGDPALRALPIYSRV